MKAGLWDKKASGYLALSASQASAIPASRNDGQKGMPMATETAVTMKHPAAAAFQGISSSFHVVKLETGYSIAWEYSARQVTEKS